MRDRVNPHQVMPLTIEPPSPLPIAIRSASPPAQEPRFIVGQDGRGRWIAVETHGLAGGIFRSCKDAIHYAEGETQRRPEAVVISMERVEFAWAG